MKQTLWTIQDEAAYSIFEKCGILRACEEHLFCGECFLHAYDWLSNQMTLRIGAPPEGVRYPVWAWYQWEGKRKRMDLRFGGYAKRGTPLVQITFESDPMDFLLSDFDEWHSVLTNDYIADNEYEYNEFYNNGGEHRIDEIIKSWDKIFDLDRHIPDWNYPPERKSIQATLWQIHISQVTKVEHFLAK